MIPMYNEEFENTLLEIMDALTEKGYNPREQIRAYARTGDESYITRHNDAREKIKNLDKEQVLDYLRSHK